ncbi:GMP synthase [gamma proteobacterium HTCC5015]|nr:GMP synthase [gamma proteobacterium HTCC5015]
MNIEVFQHVPFEGPASLRDWAQLRGHELNHCNWYNGERPRALDQYDLLVILGGPMSIHDEREHTWLAEEKVLIRRAIDSGKPVLGICLGAQLIAAVLGAEVYRGPQREIGWFPLERCGQQALGDHFDGLMAFHWHADTFSLPDGSEWLARSQAYANQAFSWHERVVGLQFHMEFTADTARRLVSHCADELDGSRFVQSAEDMLAVPARFAKANMALYNFLDDWLGRLGLDDRVVQKRSIKQR